VEFPVIALVPPRSWAPADRALRALGDRAPGGTPAYSWVAFLSANGVERFLGRIRARDGGRGLLRACRLAAIGPATARVLRARGLRPDVVATAATSEGLVRALRGRIGAGDRVLLPRTDIGREVLPEALRRCGAAVDEVTVYRTVPARGRGAAAMRAALRSGGVDVVTFASARTARNFAEAMGRGTLRRMAPGVRIASIGPVTSEACRSAGLPVHVEATQPSFPALVRAVAALFR
jgi:uroporphyrinogen III methyltransferase/synthase